MSNKIFSNPSDVFESQLNDIFSRNKKDEIDILFRVLSLILHNNSHNKDIIDLYKVLDLNSFSKVINVMDNKLVKFPSKEEFKDSLLFALCYYYREIENLSWDEIKKILPFDFSSFSYGIRIRNLNHYIVDQMTDLFKSMEKFND